VCDAALDALLLPLRQLQLRLERVDLLPEGERLHLLRGVSADGGREVAAAEAEARLNERTACRARARRAGVLASSGKE